MTEPWTSTFDVAFSDSVKAVQARKGSRAGFERRAAAGFRDAVTEDLVAFLARRDSFYFATASAAGRPYIQHRGGPPGFLKPLDAATLGFADFSGNRQYITLGNLAENDRACIFLMDYVNRQRVKLWGRARVVAEDAALFEHLAMPGYAGRIEQVILFAVEAWDINCPQHITPRYDEAGVAEAFARLQGRIEELEAEIGRLKQAGATEPR